MREMGNHRFKLCDIMPNAWFYKLWNMGRKIKQITHHSHKKKQSSSSSTTQPSNPKQPQQFNPRKSHYFARQPNQNVSDSNSNDPLRKPCQHTPSRITTTIKSDAPADHSSSQFDSSDDSEFPEPEFRIDRILPIKAFHQTASWPSNSRSSCRLNVKPDDIVIDVDKSSIARQDGKLKGNDSLSEFELPPIRVKKKETKPRSRMSTYEEPKVHNSLKVKIVKEDKASVKEQRTAHIRRLAVSSPRTKLRQNSPRIGSRKIRIQTCGRKSVSSSATNSSSSRRWISDSLAIAQSSWNPERDFRESMVEMIVENNIRASKDLEDLLACYLHLNSEEYHDLIIEVFKQIWFDLTDTSGK